VLVIVGLEDEHVVLLNQDTLFVRALERQRTVDAARQQLLIARVLPKQMWPSVVSPASIYWMWAVLDFGTE
jgi:hypothetical protein